MIFKGNKQGVIKYILKVRKDVRFMRTIIKVDPSKCIGCNKCVRVCPVHEANVTQLAEGSDDKFVTTVKPEKCINCGECVKACVHGARLFEDDTQTVFEMLSRGEKIAVIVAPAIKNALPGNGWKNCLEKLRTLGNGNVKIYDVAYGADICTWAHARLVTDSNGKKLISQPCPAIVNYIEKYQPALLNNLSPVHSPASCEAIYLKKHCGVTTPIVLLSPCIAKTSETQRGGFDYNITFQNLLKKFDEENIVVSMTASSDFEFNGDTGILGQLYPRPAGLKDNLLAVNPNLVISTSEGPQSVYKRIQRYAKVTDAERPNVLDVLNCEFGCNMGTATVPGIRLADVEKNMSKLELDVQSQRGGFFSKDKIYKIFDKKLQVYDYLCTYQNQHIIEHEPTADELEPIYKSLNKLTEESRKINCTACGYDTCKEMCRAIYKGLNIPQNCVYYMKQKLRKDVEQIQYMYDIMKQEKKTLELAVKTVTEGRKSMQSAIDKVDENSDNIMDTVKQVGTILDDFIALCDMSINTGMDKESVKKTKSLAEKAKAQASQMLLYVTETKTNKDAIVKSVDKLGTQVTSLVEAFNVLNDSFHN